MRKASTYRGARRNEARADRKAARAEKRPAALLAWKDGEIASAANARAKLKERTIMANEANQAVAKALVEAGPLAGFSIANATFLKFYRAQKRTRVVNRIVRGLESSALRHAQSSI